MTDRMDLESIFSRGLKCGLICGSLIGFALGYALRFFIYG